MTLMNKIEVASAEEFAPLVKAHERVLVDFYKDNCPGCKMLDLSLGKFEGSVAADGITMLKVKLETVGEALFHEYGLRQTPSLLFFMNGQEAQRLAGFASPAQIEALVAGQ